MPVVSLFFNQHQQHHTSAKKNLQKTTFSKSWRCFGMLRLSLAALARLIQHHPCDQSQAA